MRLTERHDGTIRIEPDLITVIFPDQGHTHREIRVGDEGCLATAKDISPNTLLRGWPTEYRVSLYAAPDGVGGNMDPKIKRLHGWRGTTNDWSSYAWGWRRVESITPRRRGVGYVVILSADLRPDAD